MADLVPGQRVRCLYGTGFVVSVEREKLVTLKLDNGQTKIIEQQEIERMVTKGAPKVVKTTTTTVVESGSRSAPAPDKVEKTVVTKPGGGGA